MKVLVWCEGWVDVPGTYCVEREGDYRLVGHDEYSIQKDLNLVAVGLVRVHGLEELC